MSAPLELEDAQARLLGLLSPTPARACPVDESAGLFLAQPVIARRTQPSADLSAMDGYATAGEGPWQIKGESRAGAPFDMVLGKGDAIRISTGAQMPLGADAVLVQEEAQVDGTRLTATEPPTARFIRRAGLDFKASDTLLEAGTRMGAAQIALTRAGGVAEVVTHDAPRVAVIECGDELARDPTSCEPHQTPAVNGAMLAAMARDAGAQVRPIGPVADDAEEITRAVLAASEDATLLVISGGASVGPHDLVKPALEAAGFTLDFCDQAGQAAAGRTPRRHGGAGAAGQSGVELRHRLPVHGTRTPAHGGCEGLPAARDPHAARPRSASRRRQARVSARVVDARGAGRGGASGQLCADPARTGASTHRPAGPCRSIRSGCVCSGVPVGNPHICLTCSGWLPSCSAFVRMTPRTSNAEKKSDVDGETA